MSATDLAGVRQPAGSAAVKGLPPCRQRHIARLVALDRHPWFLALVVAGFAYLLTPDRSLMPTDFHLFTTAGHALLRGHLSAVFANPLVQAGPVTVAGMALAQDATAWAMSRAAPLLDFGLGLFNAGALIQAVRLAAARPGSGRGAATLAASVFAVAYGIVSTTDAHPTHAVIPLLWLMAARAARERRPVTIGLLLGLTTGLDTWGLLGFGLLLALPRAKAVAAATVAVMVTAAWWLPFILVGSLHSFSMQWPAVPGSVPALLFGSGPVPWSYRLLQGFAAVLAGALMAWRLRRSDHMRWLFPATVVSARLALDPLSWEYYQVPLTVMLLAGAGAVLTRGDVQVSWRRCLDTIEGSLRRPRQAMSSPLPWIGLALLLPPVAGLMPGPLASYGPSALCIALLGWLVPKEAASRVEPWSVQGSRGNRRHYPDVLNSRSPGGPVVRLLRRAERASGRARAGPDSSFGSHSDAGPRAPDGAAGRSRTRGGAGHSHADEDRAG